MKKQKTITLESSEEVTLDSLTDREKMIYEAGYDEGISDAGNAAIIVVLITIGIIALTVIIYN